MDTIHDKYIMYVGTYTNGESEGIYIFNFDAASGRLEPAGPAVKLENPSYLAVSPDGSYLYSIMEIEEYEGKPGGAVAAYFIGGVDGKIIPRLLNFQPTKGRTPCHISTDSRNRFLFAANYTEGTVSVFPLNPDGTIAPVSSIVRHTGSGPNAERQEKPHAHFVSLTPDEKYLCAVDLGIDRIVAYEFNSGNGAITPSEKMTVKTRPGSGPRHLAFHPDGKHAYLINELSSDVDVLEYLPSEMKFTAIQHISALPAGYTGISYCSAVHVSPDGEYLYGSNRGHDSIAVFKIDRKSGKTDLVSIEPTLGSFPRDFSLDPTGNFLFAANQYSGTIVPFKVIRDTGRLEWTGNIINVPEPACIKFVKV